MNISDEALHFLRSSTWIRIESKEKTHFWRGKNIRILLTGGWHAEKQFADDTTSATPRFGALITDRRPQSCQPARTGAGILEKCTSEHCEGRAARRQELFSPLISTCPLFQWSNRWRLLFTLLNTHWTHSPAEGHVRLRGLRYFALGARENLVPGRTL